MSAAGALSSRPDAGPGPRVRRTDEDEVRTDERVHFTYQFLRRSIFYFLTDKENSGYHLRCMERLLEFTEGERAAIETSRGAKTPSVRKQRY